MVNNSLIFKVTLFLYILFSIQPLDAFALSGIPIRQPMPIKESLFISLKILIFLSLPLIIFTWLLIRSKPEKRSLIIKIIFSVFVLIIIGLFSLFYNGFKYPLLKPDQEKIVQEKINYLTWKQYQNEGFGFELKYPDEAKLFGDFDKDKSISIFKDEISEGTGLNLSYLDKSSGQVASEMAGNYEIISDKKIIFNGYSARGLIHKSEVGGPYRIILISRGEGTFQIKHWVGKYDDILSTFKFIE